MTRKVSGSFYVRGILRGSLAGSLVTFGLLGFTAIFIRYSGSAMM